MCAYFCSNLIQSNGTIFYSINNITWFWYIKELFSLSSVFANCVNLLFDREMPCECPWWPPCSITKMLFIFINIFRWISLFPAMIRHILQLIQNVRLTHRIIIANLWHWLEVQYILQLIVILAHEFLLLQ